MNISPVMNQDSTLLLDPLEKTVSDVSQTTEKVTKKFSYFMIELLEKFQANSDKSRLLNLQHKLHADDYHKSSGDWEIFYQKGISALHVGGAGAVFALGKIGELASNGATTYTQTLVSSATSDKDRARQSSSNADQVQSILQSLIDKLHSAVQQIVQTEKMSG